LVFLHALGQAPGEGSRRRRLDGIHE
jgi:hypothetical protein